MSYMLRWSDGCSHAVQFRLDGGKNLAESIATALCDFRRARPQARAELHVLTDKKNNRWSNPIITWGVDETLTESIQSIGAANVGRDAVCPHGGYTHVINLPDRPADQPGSNPVVRGTDYVLIVGPDCWHEDTVYRGVMAALQSHLRFSGFLSDITDTIQGRDPYARRAE